MSTTLENNAFTLNLSSSEWQKSKVYRFHLLITEDEPGLFSAVVLNLPGIGSCGDTKEQAIDNAKEAIRGALEEYEESREEIPWKDTSSVEIPTKAEQKWIIVDA